MLVGMLANWNPLTYQDAQKGSHFIQLCHNRNIPLIFLQNSGHLPDDCSPHILSSGKVSSSKCIFFFLSFKKSKLLHILIFSTLFYFIFMAYLKIQIIV